MKSYRSIYAFAIEMEGRLQKVFCPIVRTKDVVMTKLSDKTTSYSNLPGLFFVIFAKGSLLKRLEDSNFEKKNVDLFLVDKNRDLVILKRQNFLVS